MRNPVSSYETTKGPFLEKNAVQSLDRALDIIELLSLEREGLGVTEIGNRISLHKSTVHRLLNSLADRGYIEKVERSSLYKLGFKFVEIASLRLNHLELKIEAVAPLRRLAESLGQTVHLAILDGTEVVYIEKIEPVSTLRMYSQIGRRAPLHCTALGKSLLSGLSDDQLALLVGQLSFQRFTSDTLTKPEQLIREVEQVRKVGWSLDDNENEEGIRCIAAPIRDYARNVIAAISVSGDKKIISKKRESEIAQHVKDTAYTISQRMGYVVVNQGGQP